jgi:hypothetical protein
MARASLLIAVSIIAFPAAAQPSDRATSPTKERDCYRIEVYRTREGALVADARDMFAVQADGTWRTRRQCPPLLRPSRHKEPH